MGDALHGGDVESADPEATIDASDRVASTAEPVPLTAAAPSAPTDYAELATVERRHYAVGSEIARGGMGRVVEARDLRLGRQVAIKELLPKNRDVARRFEREARITARLQHPAIIHIYEAGVWPGGEPFYAMPKVSGRSLDVVVSERATLDERLALVPNVIAVADALAYAHNANVIHRDLKPSNVLVGEFGETVVIDWGLAKELGAPASEPAVADAKESLQLQVRTTAEDTASGGIVGTPAYMPPEQARGEQVDQRADVYALGALLYKVLAGVPPYRGSSSAEVLEQVKAGPPPSIAESAPGAPVDLVAIVEKAMAREPVARYTSAGELAKDLKRFQTGQLVGAHRYTRRQLLARWLRRYRVAVAITTTAVILLGVLAAFSVRRIVDEKERAEQERTKAELGRRQLLEERGREQLLAGHAGAALAYLVGAASDGVTSSAQGFLIADAMRAFDAQLAYRRAGDAHTMLAAVSSGSRVAVGGTSVIVWKNTGGSSDELTAPAPVRVVAIDAGETQIAGAVEDGTIYVWSLSDKMLRHTLRGHAGAVLDLAFSPDGRSLVSAGVDAVARIWDLGTERPLESKCHSGPVVSARYRGDGARIVTASSDGTACVIDARSGSEVPLRGHTAAVNSATFSPDGALVLTASDDGTARVWNPDRGKPVVAALRHDAGSTVDVALMTADGRVITAGSDLSIRVWSLPAELPDYGTPGTAKPLARLTGHTGAVVSAALAGDGTLLATGSFDNTARLWSLETNELVGVFEHGDVVGTVAFAAGDHLLATASRDGAARLWQLPGPAVRADVASAVHALAVDGDRVVAGLDSSRVTVLQKGHDDRSLDGHTGRVLAVALTTSGLVTAGEDADAILWSGPDWKQGRPFGGHDARTEALASDGEQLAMLVGGKVELWSLAPLQRRKVIEATSPIRAIAMTREPPPMSGGLLAIAGDNGLLRLFDSRGEPVGDLVANGRTYRTLAFSADGTRLAGAGTGVAAVWRVDARDEVTPLEGPVGVVRGIAFACGGACVVTAGDDGHARVWDAAKGKLLGTRGGGIGAVTALAVNGDTLWLGTQQGVVGAWDLRVTKATAQELRAFMNEKHVPESLEDDDVVRRRGHER